MNTELILMFGALILLAVSGLLVFCFTEAKGKNTPYARDEIAQDIDTNNKVAKKPNKKQNGKNEGQHKVATPH
jgi:hypothetical protein